MERHFYDLSSFSIQTGRIGCLRTLGVIPIVAGDSIELDVSGILRLSQLRRELSIDAVLDMFVFFCPHRHAYDAGGASLWQRFIKDGVDEAVTFPTWTVPTGVGDHFQIFGMDIRSGAVLPLWLPYGYQQIHNRWFRHPLDFQDIREDGMTPAAFVAYNFPTVQLSNSDFRHRFVQGAGRHWNRKFIDGFLCCHLKRPWNAYNVELPAADRQVPAATVLDLLELRRVKARYKTELERAYFGQRYDDLMQRVWDTQVSVDADERPELCFRKTQFLSGHDVDGTDDAALGQAVGKSATGVNMYMPKKYFTEHGSLWIMALVRFPQVVHGECNPMCIKAQPTYKEIAADPEVLMSEPPQVLNFKDWNASIASDAFPANLGSRSGDPPSAKPVIPYAQWYRTGFHFVGTDFENLPGFPFLSSGDAYMTSGSRDAAYINSAVYDNMFATLQLQHWRCQLKLGIGAMRKVPPPLTSIMAGTR